MWHTRKGKAKASVHRVLVTSVTDGIRHAVPCHLEGMCLEPEAARWTLREGRSPFLLSLLQGRSGHSLASEDKQLLDASGSLSLGQWCLLKLASCQFLTTWRGALFGCNPCCSKKAEQEKLFLRWKKWQQSLMSMRMILEKGKIWWERGELLEWSLWWLGPGDGTWQGIVSEPSWGVEGRPGRN